MHGLETPTLALSDISKVAVLHEAPLPVLQLDIFEQLPTPRVLGLRPARAAPPSRSQTRVGGDTQSWPIVRKKLSPNQSSVSPADAYVGSAYS